MAPSSTPFDASRRELLAARDARQAAIDRHLRGPGSALVAVSLSIPGEAKSPPGALELFGWGCRELAYSFPGALELYRAQDALGPFALWEVAVEPKVVKERCVAIETARPEARLLDLDVYSTAGGSIDRGSLHLPDRLCLCCDAPARECIRVGRHGFPELVARTRQLLAGGRD